MSENFSQETKCGIGGYIALVLAIVIFSGVFYKMPKDLAWLGCLDYTTLCGSWGKVASMTAGKATNFIGQGGISARQGFLFGFSLCPGVMLAMGLIEVLSHYGALKAAQVLVTPLLRPLLGIPGACALPMITDLQSTDGGAAITRAMYDQGILDKKGLVVVCGWQYAGAGMVSNYYTTVVPGIYAISAFLVPVWCPVLINFCMKFVGGAFVRTVLSTVYRKDFENV
ncbi:MAG: hypothetical protein HUK26_00790 [Duodenibacillus sp.]|nr:hypothetical protein [Duodenibacillus sp.]